MVARRSSRSLLLFGLVALALVPAKVWPLGPVGKVLRVATTPPTGTRSQVAMDSTGGFVVVWDRLGADSDGYGILARRYAPGPMPLGDAFLVNSTTQGDQESPHVAMAEDGTFVVVWNSDGQDGDGLGIYGQRYDAAGSSIGGEFQINTATQDSQQLDDVAMDSTGNFIVVWSTITLNHSSIRGQGYDAMGVPQGNEFVVTEIEPDTYSSPRVAMGTVGAFTVAWLGGPKMRHYSLSGVPQGPEVTLTALNGPVLDLDIGVDAAGKVVVVWAATPYASVQRLDSSGFPLGDPVRLTAKVRPYNDFVELSARPDGSFVVLWAAGALPQARAFDSSGVPLGASLDVAGAWQGFFGSGFFGAVSLGLGISLAGDFVVVWDGGLFNKTGQVKSTGVFARWFDHRACQIVLKAKPRNITVGGKVRFIAKLSPCARETGDPVHLRKGGKKVASKKTGEGPKVVFRLKITKTATYRARMPAILERDLLGGVSDKVRVRVARP